MREFCQESQMNLTMKSFLKFIWILWWVTFTSQENSLGSKGFSENNRAAEVLNSHEHVMSDSHQ